MWYDWKCCDAARVKIVIGQIFRYAIVADKAEHEPTAEKMKMKRVHIVPLAAQTVELWKTDE